MANYIMANRQQRKHQNMLLRKAAEKRKLQEAKLGINQKIPQNLSGPERWALVDTINKTQNPKQKQTSWQQVIAGDKEVSYYNKQGKKVTKVQSEHNITKTDYKKIKSI
tara:strand:+ start:93 stop:419 length:327 start_codon:yes stop_codon:yes gene_type:complete